jgi:hypothetical protein
MGQQRPIDALQQVVIVARGTDRQPKLLGQRQQQGARRQVGVGQVSGNGIFGQGLQQAPAEQRLAGANLAGDLDETFAAVQRDEQGVERFLVAAGLSPSEGSQLDG